MHELIAKHDLKNNARIDENEVTLEPLYEVASKVWSKHS